MSTTYSILAFCLFGLSALAGGSLVLLTLGFVNLAASVAFGYLELREECLDLEARMKK